ncbi:MAG TPA: transketolase [Cyanobacteria bacterium UBA8156]|nr:transketolase [Cyanobacteria bacterium UBA8156]
MVALPEFCEGILHFDEAYTERFPEVAPWLQTPVLREGQTRLTDLTQPAAAFQTLLYADALRYLTLQITASKASGHPGGFASQAEAYAALVLLGHKNILTEVGHHAPGFYSAMFLDRSLEAMDIFTVQQLGDRFRELHGLLGHLSGYIPGILAPAGPLGQGQHFAMAAALLHPETLFPFTLGDGGLGEPYPMSSMIHFHEAYPGVTNFLPVLVWNGFSQEHHSMVATKTNEQMMAYWHGNGFEEVVLVDAKDFDDTGSENPYVDSTQFSLKQRLTFTQAVLQGVDEATRSALSGKLTVFILKQLKGAGAHALGAKSHNLYAKDTLAAPHMVAAMQRRALPVAAWALVRTNAERAGGGPAQEVAVTETVQPLPDLGELPLNAFLLGDKQVATTAMGALVAAVGEHDRTFVVTNADGNEASGIGNINQALKIRHPIADALYNQMPTGQVYEPLSEDACAGLAAGLALMGGRSLWCSYESFAINGLPIWQTVTQAMAELRRPTPSTICLFTAGALEQGRNGWTHQRPEIEAYLAAMQRNGNVYLLFPPDANTVQVCYEWALTTHNKGIAIVASKSPLPVRLTFDQGRQALQQGAIVLQELPGEKTVVLAVAGDMVLLPVLEAAERLQQEGIGTRVVSVVNPRRLYRPASVAWETCAEPDGEFLGNREFDELFAGDALLGVAGGPAAVLEPVLLRSRLPRDVVAWRRGETTASPDLLFQYNNLSPDKLADRAAALLL